MPADVRKFAQQLLRIFLIDSIAFGPGSPKIPVPYLQAR
jgi:hypothetical protein